MHALRLCAQFDDPTYIEEEIAAAKAAKAAEAAVSEFAAVELVSFGIVGSAGIAGGGGTVSSGATDAAPCLRPSLMSHKAAPRAARVGQTLEFPSAASLLHRMEATVPSPLARAGSPSSPAGAAVDNSVDGGSDGDAEEPPSGDEGAAGAPEDGTPAVGAPGKGPGPKKKRVMGPKVLLFCRGHELGDVVAERGTGWCTSAQCSGLTTLGAIAFYLRADYPRNGDPHAPGQVRGGRAVGQPAVVLLLSGGPVRGVPPTDRSTRTQCHAREWESVRSP